MAKIPNRNHKGVKVHGTGHGRTPIASGNMPTVEAAWRIANALDRGDNPAPRVKPPKPKPKPKKHHPAEDGPAPFKTWAEWRKANPDKARGTKASRKAAWRRWRKRKRARDRVAP